MTKGTASLGKKRVKCHIMCLRCGRRSFHVQHKRCASCGFPDKKMRRYNWGYKAKRRRRMGTGKCKHLKWVQKRFDNGLRVPSSKPRQHV